MAWQKTPDGSFLDHSGKVLFFSIDRFVNDICLGRCCFICGAQPGSKVFNDEHVIPEWVLRKFDLFDRTITLPNGGTVKYGRFKVRSSGTRNHSQAGLSNPYRPRLSRHRQMKLTWSSPLPIEDVNCNAYSQEQGRRKAVPNGTSHLGHQGQDGTPLMLKQGYLSALRGCGLFAKPRDSFRPPSTAS
jgi:hypothetical protein